MAVVNMYDITDLTMTVHENPEWFTRALFGGRFIQGNYVTPLMGVKDQELLSKIDLTDNILQIDTFDCAWTPEQILKLSEKKASVKTYKINLEQCIDELEKKRTIYQLSPGAKNESLPDELEAATLQLLAIGLSNEIEEMVIAGDSTVDPDSIDGYVKQLKDSPDTIKINGATITSANVIAAIEEVYAAAPEEVLQGEQNGSLFMLVSYKTRQVLRQALATRDNQVVAQNFSMDAETDPRNPKLYYLGVEIVPVKGLKNSEVILYDRSNFLFLTDLMSDLESIRLGQKAAPEDNVVFIDGRLRLGAAVLFEDEVVFRSEDNAAPAPEPEG